MWRPRWGPVKLEIQINRSHLPAFFSKAQACFPLSSSVSILSALRCYFRDCAEEEMRMSCNGCRVLRKGCSENCSIRPCLQWIKSHDSQANATVFLAKFYGRAGLMNLINAGPDHLRPAIFRSLLYEACGRIVNPIYGSVGLLWSGSWQLCQAAVEAVLKGAPIIPITSEAAANGHGPPLKPYDIRHVAKDENSMASDRLRRVKTRSRHNRSVGKPKSSKNSPIDSVVNPAGAVLSDAMNRSTSHESSLSHQSEAPNIENESKESESIVSMETGEASAPVMIRSETESFQKRRYEVTEEGDIALELTLGLKPPSVSRPEQVVPVKKRKADKTSHIGACKTELGLEFPA